MTFHNPRQNFLLSRFTGTISYFEFPFKLLRKLLAEEEKVEQFVLSPLFWESPGIFDYVHLVFSWNESSSCLRCSNSRFSQSSPFFPARQPLRGAILWGTSDARKGRKPDLNPLRLKSRAFLSVPHLFFSYVNS